MCIRDRDNFLTNEHFFGYTLTMIFSRLLTTLSVRNLSCRPCTSQIKPATTEDLYDLVLCYIHTTHTCSCYGSETILGLFIFLFSYPEAYHSYPTNLKWQSKITYRKSEMLNDLFSGIFRLKCHEKILLEH